MDIIINGQKVVIDVNTDSGATKVTFPDTYIGINDQPLSISYEPATTIALAEADAQALLTNRGFPAT